MCYPPNLSLILGCALCILCSSILHDFKVSNTQAWELMTGQTPLPWCFCLNPADFVFFFQTFPHWWSQVAEQYPTWPNTQSFLQMIRQEVTPDRANFSLPGSCHGCEIGFRDVVEMWNGWIEM